MNRIAPNWIVNNVVDTVKFYTEKPGFQVAWMREKNPKFVVISRRGITLMLRQLKKEGLSRPNRLPYLETGWHTNAVEAWDA